MYLTSGAHTRTSVHANHRRHGTTHAGQLPAAGVRFQTRALPVVRRPVQMRASASGGSLNNGSHVEAVTTKEATEGKGDGKSQQEKGDSDAEEPQLVVNMDKTSSVQVDNSGKVVDAESAQHVHMDGSALDEDREAASTISNKVMHAALDAIDLVSDATDVEKPAEERLEELEGKYRMLDDRLDMVEMRLVDLGKAKDLKSKSSTSMDQAVEETSSGKGLKEVTKIHSRFTEAVNSGYLESMKQMRENLMLHEWELSNKFWAQRKGISDFEAWCVQNNEEVDYELMSQLYDSPVDPQLLQQLPPRLRSMARSFVEASCDERMREVYARCTEIAKQLAVMNASGVSSGLGSRVFGFIKRILPFKIPFLG